ncbi:prepilin-type N-terminal cleavage/methylation domain-containing protein [Acinetobacter albensis]|uniref:PulJ/GspJ family protein n=1 Tax=Acinetobacter albensis TaxID=1673609 RepID=UPI00188182CA|nr:prepilin-type N-terminal cleavage/methylation domain-containing protein [Acinetobacter albensis]MBE9399768.1 prepilin-type N-terminal cleavage/methylation domain-containing protein [Acinetobacter albensis]
MSQLQLNSKSHYQAGITLIEVLISVLLMAIIGLGGAYIASRTAVIQRNGNIQVQVINKMRQITVKADATSCSSTSSISINGTPVTTPCMLNSQTYTVDAFTAAPGPGGFGTGVASASVTVKSPSIKVSDADTFVPIKSEISP